MRNRNDYDQYDDRRNYDRRRSSQDYRYDDDMDYQGRRSQLSRDYDYDDDHRRNESRGWYDDRRSDERTWNDYGNRERTRYDDDDYRENYRDDDRYSNRSRDYDDRTEIDRRGERRGWFGDPERHREAAERRWQDNGSSGRSYGSNRLRSRYNDDNYSRMESHRGRNSQEGRGWYGDSRRHAMAAEKGWDSRR